ncbi:hypothetical protein HPP92_002946 [Vanilla planifolia]|uniref:Uncharacterized protein n=1 Tax=Vanilla planifolia TaxID=51239 RepID=A0A835S778_VANPL|nr:hypothetical protein HPP92_002946 [Vanilla planifolia]
MVEIVIVGSVDSVICFLFEPGEWEPRAVILESMNQLHGDSREGLVRELTSFNLLTVEIVNAVCPFSCVWYAASVSGQSCPSFFGIISVRGLLGFCELSKPKIAEGVINGGTPCY